MTLLEPGDFSGEINTLRGTRGLVIDTERLREVVQNDAQLGETMMRASILRRIGLLESERAGLTPLGSRHSAGTLRLGEFLTRNALPYVSVDVESDPGPQALLTLRGREERDFCAGRRLRARVP